MTDQSWRSFGQRLALGILALVAFASSVLAADRVMLGPEGDTPVAAQGNPQTANALARVRALAASAGSVRVIVGLRTAFAPEGLLTAALAAQQRREITQKRTEVLAKLPAVAARPDAQRTFETVPFVGLIVSPAELETLVQMPEVTSIQEDAPRKPSLTFSVPHIGASAAWSSGYTGAGQVVAVLDTGVDKNHPFLAGKVVSEACYSSTLTGYWSSVCPGGVTETTAPGSGVPCSADCEHGTHVAGIVAGSDGPSSLAGVAKGANLIAMQVFTEFLRPEYCGGDPPCIGAFPSDYVKGLERVLALRNTYSIAAANLSLGGGSQQSQASCDSANPLEKAAIDNLRAVGIATVIASGNEGYTNALSEPACISTAISVGSTWSRTGYNNNCLGNNLGVSALDSVSCFSNSASFLNLLAPGAFINSSVPGAGYALAAGTSQAAPHVAGAWAVMKQKKPTATVTEILNSLTETGQLIVDPRNGIAKPRINVAQAVASLGSGLPPQLLNVSKNGSGGVTSSPAGIDCGATCSVEFAHGTTVTLTATPSAGYSFAGWSGDCSGSGVCTVVMTAGRSVTASFTQAQFTLSVSKAGGGTGTVTSSPSGISCGSVCSAAFGSGAVVTLVAAPASGNVFAGWSGACTGTGNCVVTVNANTSVTASFSASPGGSGIITALSQTNLSAITNSVLNYSVLVPPGARNLVIRISGGTGDADLYVRAGQPPTESIYDCRPYVQGNEETCSFSTPTPGTYYIMLDAYSSFAGVTLTASYLVGGADISQIMYLLLLSD
jgi:uncharacterized repeat protein (TIGR02543 family)